MAENGLHFRKKTEDAIKRYLALSPTNECAIGVYKNGKIGYRASKDDLNRKFDIGSISKTFTAHHILKLCHVGLLELDTTVDHYLPLKKGRYPTVRQLLTHTAGYGPLTPMEITLPHLMLRRYSKANPYRGIKVSHVLKCLERRNRCKGGYTDFYSDFPYAVLAAVSEVVTGRAFFDDLTALLREDFGFTGSSIAEPGRSANAYLSAKPIEPWLWERDNPYIAGGGIVSDIVDMTAYAALQIESELPFVQMTHILEESSFSKRSTIGTTLGWRTYKRSDQLWHVGGVGTFRASMIVNCKRGLAVVVLGNAGGARNANVHYLAKMLYSDLKNKRIRIIEKEN